MDNEQEIRKAIAEFMGWTELSVFPYWGEANGTPPGEEPGNLIEDVPDYLHDLNACHEVEAELERRGLWERYARLIREIVPPQREFYMAVFAALHATAEQRARAAYQVISQQKEG